MDDLKDGSYWIDCGWACGMVTVKNGTLVKGCSHIFKKWLGTPADAFWKKHVKRWERLTDKK